MGVSDSQIISRKFLSFCRDFIPTLVRPEQHYVVRVYEVYAEPQTYPISGHRLALNKSL